MVLDVSGRLPKNAGQLIYSTGYAAFIGGLIGVSQGLRQQPA
jgi:hypothetical protein